MRPSLSRCDDELMRVLVVTLPDKGNYHPLLGPAAELVRRGHDVTFTCQHDISAELASAGVAGLAGAGAKVKLASGAQPPPKEPSGEKLAKHLFDPVSLAGGPRDGRSGGVEQCGAAEEAELRAAR